MGLNSRLEVALKNRGGLSVTEVSPGGIAQEVGIEVGDRIASINGHEVQDPIDCRYFCSEEKLLIELIKKNGEVWELEIEKEADEDIGVDFDPMKIRRCPNECFFCFVDQNPEGQRSELYIRDEDYRYSFLFGNYITLTNLTKKDKERVFEQRLSPLYISVHATDPELRKFILGNPKARPVLGEIREMVEHGIRLHTQIVLCPGVNDGAYLTQSIEELVGFFPGVGSLAVVPVGITGHRKGLYRIEEVSEGYARETLEILAGWQARFLKEYDYPFVFPSDEFFIKANLPFPPLSDYYDLPQLENGVGMVPLFREEVEKAASTLPKALRAPKTVTLVTGISFEEHFKKALRRIRVSGLTLRPVAIRNDFFGASATVTGLLTGRDVIEQLKSRSLGDLVVIPRVTLNERGYFLDNTTPEDVQKALGVETVMVQQDAKRLADLVEGLA